MILGYAFLFLAALVIAVGFLARKRVRETVRHRRTDVDDDAIRRILDEGALETDDDEPLDLEEIAREEERFWEESWDDPEGPFHP